MAYIVKIEGQDIPLPDEIGSDDAKVKQALTPFYPEAANAMITRVEKDGTTTITVTKRAGTKGGRKRPGKTPFERLEAVRENKNPAIALYEELQARPDGFLEPEAVLAMGYRIEKALDDGRNQAEAVQHALRRLEEAQAQPGPATPLGF